MQVADVRPRESRSRDLSLLCDECCARIMRAAELPRLSSKRAPPPAQLYVGLGGFTAGAIAAGATVVVGVDHAAVPLRMWAANNPAGRAVLAKLGPGANVDLPPPSPELHVHVSPPCTELSVARGGSAAADGVDGGLAQMRWALTLVLERGDHSWSLENVSTPATRALLTEFATRLPDQVAWATLDAADYGAPQNRIRLIAGPPKLMRVLQQMPVSKRVSVRDAFSARGLQLPATHFKNQTRNRDGTPCMRSVEEPSFTVTASHALTWCDSSGQTVRVMKARESAVCMGFPTRWRLPCGSRDAQKAVGNALSVEMAKKIIEAAISALSGTPPPRVESTASPTPLTEAPSSPAVPLVRPQADDSLRRVCRRLGRIESLLRQVVESKESKGAPMAERAWLPLHDELLCDTGDDPAPTDARERVASARASGERARREEKR